MGDLCEVSVFLCSLARSRHFSPSPVFRVLARRASGITSPPIPNFVLPG